MRGVLIGWLLSFGLVVGAQAAGTVDMTKPPPLAKGVDAMPIIAEPADDAQRRLNSAVKRLDDKARKAMADCRRSAGETATARGEKDAGGDYDWKRTVTVTMHGPRFLSYRIHDTTYCGGAYPSASTDAIVYDLTTGRPVDWTKLLPASLTGQVALDDSTDGWKTVTLSSPKLFALYLEGYRPRPGRKPEPKDDAECRDAITPTDGHPPAMTVWLDTVEGGLDVYFYVAHVVQANVDVVTIPVASLRALGAKPVLLDALEAAQRAEGRGATPRR